MSRVLRAKSQRSRASQQDKAAVIFTEHPPVTLFEGEMIDSVLVNRVIADTEPSGVALAFEPGEGGVLRRKPRAPGERIFDRLMIERTIVAARVMAMVSFSAFHWMLQSGWSEPSARNGILLLLVLFENVHIGNCRSETKSAFRLSLLRSPILLAGTIGAFLSTLWRDALAGGSKNPENGAYGAACIPAIIRIGAHRSGSDRTP